MNFQDFLKWGGIALIGVGILGVILPGGKLIGNNWYFTSAENWGHLIAGSILLFVWHFDSSALNRKTIFATVAVAFYFVLAGFLVRDLTSPNYYNVANFEYPWDELLHLVFVIWPIWIIWREKRRAQF